MTDEIPPGPFDPDVSDEDPEDVLVLLDRLEELVGVGRRMPFSTRIASFESRPRTSRSASR